MINMCEHCSCKWLSFCSTVEAENILTECNHSASMNNNRSRNPASLKAGVFKISQTAWEIGSRQRVLKCIFLHSVQFVLLMRFLQYNCFSHGSCRINCRCGMYLLAVLFHLYSVSYWLSLHQAESHMFLKPCCWAKCSSVLPFLIQKRWVSYIWVVCFKWKRYFGTEWYTLII